MTEVSETEEVESSTEEEAESSTVESSNEAGTTTSDVVSGTGTGLGTGLRTFVQQSSTVSTAAGAVKTVGVGMGFAGGVVGVLVMI